MFKKILIAADESPAASLLITYATALTSIGVREVLLAHCFSLREHVAFPVQTKANQEAFLFKAGEGLREKDITVNVMAEDCLPGIRIPEIALENNCSVILTASHGQSLVEAISLGSTTMEILHRSKVPVLVLPMKAVASEEMKARFTEKWAPGDHILYATDFSDDSMAAFDYVCDIVRYGARRVTLLHIQDKAKIGDHLSHRLDSFNSTDRGRLNALKMRLAAVCDARIHIALSYGAPANEIVQCAYKRQASLLILGARGRGYVSEVFLGSVSHNVVRHAPAPVLVVTSRQTSAPQ